MQAALETRVAQLFNGTYGVLLCIVAAVGSINRRLPVADGLGV